MTTPVAHVPTTTQVDIRRVLTYVLIAAMAAALAAVVVFGLQGAEDTAPAAEADNVREWTRTELLDHLTRINGYAVTGTAASGMAGTISSTAGTAPATDVTQEETLERLYRINGVFPASPVVPPSVR